MADYNWISCSISHCNQGAKPLQCRGLGAQPHSAEAWGISAEGAAGSGNAAPEGAGVPGGAAPSGAKQKLDFQGEWRLHGPPRVNQILWMFSFLIAFLICCVSCRFAFIISHCAFIIYRFSYFSSHFSFHNSYITCNMSHLSCLVSHFTFIRRV